MDREVYDHSSVMDSPLLVVAPVVKKRTLKGQYIVSIKRVRDDKNLDNLRCVW